jgi:predicted enzyme related to lactoylglutathione lyase
VIHHIQSFAVFVNNVDRAADFYRDTLGLPVSRQGSFGMELFHEPPHLGVHPAVHPDSKALVGRHTGITFYVPGLLHFCGVLHERGVRFVSEPTRMAWGVMAMIADPEGNVFALWDDLPPDDEAPA